MGICYDGDVNVPVFDEKGDELLREIQDDVLAGLGENVVIEIDEGERHSNVERKESEI